GGLRGVAAHEVLDQVRQHRNDDADREHIEHHRHEDEGECRAAGSEKRGLRHELGVTYEVWSVTSDGRKCKCGDVRRAHYTLHATPYTSLPFSHCSTVLGQSSLSSRERERSASSFPSV